MEIQLNRVDENYRMKATNNRGDILYTDGTASIGASERGWRPMELLLVSLAGCSCIDLISVLKKQRQDIQDVKIDLSGTRRPGTPSPYESIALHFTFTGKIKPEKVDKAIELTKGKYCSVYFSLHPDIDVRYTYDIISS